MIHLYEEVERLFALYPSPASVAEKIEFFTCCYSPPDKVSDGGGLADEGEDIEVIEAALEQAAATRTENPRLRRCRTTRRPRKPVCQTQRRVRL
jgi:hypothetical protein